MLLNLNSAEPLYNQIAMLIKDEILKNTYQVDEQVPSTNDLSKLLKINPATARKGLTILCDEEILYKKRGIGMFVSPCAQEIIRGQKSHDFKKEFFEKMLNEANQIGLTKSDLIKMIQTSELED